MIFIIEILSEQSCTLNGVGYGRIYIITCIILGILTKVALNLMNKIVPLGKGKLTTSYYQGVIQYTKL